MERNIPKNVNLRQQNRKIDSEEKLIKYIRTQLGEPLITVDVTDEAISQLIDDAFHLFSDWIYNAQQNQVFIIETTPGVQDYILDDRVQAIQSVSFSTNLTGRGYSSGGGGGSWAGISLGQILPPMYVPYVDFQGNMSHLESYGRFNNFCSSNFSVSGVAGGVAGVHTGASSSNVEPAYAAMANADNLSSLFAHNVSFDFNSQNNILRIFEPMNGPIAIEAAMYYIPNPDHDNAYGHPWIKAYALNLVKRHWGGVVGKYDSPLVGGATINYQRLIDEAQSELDRLNEELIERWSEPLGIFSA